MRRTILISVLILVIVVFAIEVLGGSRVPPDTLERWLSLASPELQTKCDSLLMRFAGRPDSSEKSEVRRLKVYSHQYVSTDDGTYRLLLLGCLGEGEILVLDSCEQSRVLLRKRMNLPDIYNSLGGLKDINNDGVPELSVSMGSGSHGMYRTFVSLYKDSLAFIYDEGKRYQFFAPGGGIGVEDLDGDSVCEVVIQDMIWPGEKDPPERRDFIYYWRDSAYFLTDTVEIR